MKLLQFTKAGKAIGERREPAACHSELCELWRVTAACGRQLLDGIVTDVQAGHVPQVSDA